VPRKLNGKTIRPKKKKGAIQVSSLSRTVTPRETDAEDATKEKIPSSSKGRGRPDNVQKPKKTGRVKKRTVTRFLYATEVVTRAREAKKTDLRHRHSPAKHLFPCGSDERKNKKAKGGGSTGGPLNRLNVAVSTNKGQFGNRGREERAGVGGGGQNQGKREKGSQKKRPRSLEPVFAKFQKSGKE